MSIASASSINSTSGDFKLGFGIGYGEVNGEDAFALGFVSQSENEKIKMSFNIGINEHVDTSLGVGIFFKLRWFKMYKNRTRMREWNEQQQKLLSVNLISGTVG